jgi:secreted PhoX family phosphatase
VRARQYAVETPLGVLTPDSGPLVSYQYGPGVFLMKRLPLLPRHGSRSRLTCEFRCGNAVPVRGDERGHVKQFLTVPVGAETCGPLVSEDQRTVFVAVQHPGEIDGANPDEPASTWPYGGQPRPSVACVWKD